MKRITIHAGFSLIALCLLITIAWQWANIRKQNSLAQALAAIPAVLSTLSDEQIIQEPQLSIPEVALAYANALSRGNNLAEAELQYNKLIRSHALGEIGQAAQFNLANAYLRQGMNSNIPVNRVGPMLELAKQRYRDLLNVTPAHWEARYNLEKALRLAPELALELEEDKGDPIKRVRVIVPGFEKMDLP